MGTKFLQHYFLILKAFSINKGKIGGAAKYWVLFLAMATAATTVILIRTAEALSKCEALLQRFYLNQQRIPPSASKKTEPHSKHQSVQADGTALPGLGTGERQGWWGWAKLSPKYCDC